MMLLSFLFGPQNILRQLKSLHQWLFSFLLLVSAATFLFYPTGRGKYR